MTYTKLSSFSSLTSFAVTTSYNIGLFYILALIAKYGCRRLQGPKAPVPPIFAPDVCNLYSRNFKFVIQISHDTI